MDLVIGNGLIGSALKTILKPNLVPCLMTTRKTLDLSTDHWELPECNTAFICAGETSTERCEKYPEETKLVNVTNTIKLAKKLTETKRVKVIWLSSERVFDGSKPFRKVTDEVCPTSEYGRQKVETEKALLEEGCIVIRFSKVIGQAIPLFEGWARDLKAGKIIHPYSDMRMSPLPLKFVVQFIERVSKASNKVYPRYGNYPKVGELYQVSGLKDLSYEQIAYHLGAYIGADMKLIQPIEAPQSHLNTTLDDERISRFLGMAIPDVWETICNWETDNLGALAVDWGR